MNTERKPDEEGQIVRKPEPRDRPKREEHDVWGDWNTKTYSGKKKAAILEESENVEPELPKTLRGEMGRRPKLLMDTEDAWDETTAGPSK